MQRDCGHTGHSKGSAKAVGTRLRKAYEPDWFLATRIFRGRDDHLWKVTMERGGLSVLGNKND